jgi:hypothetical protein
MNNGMWIIIDVPLFTCSETGEGGRRTRREGEAYLAWKELLVREVDKTLVEESVLPLPPPLWRKKENNQCKGRSVVALLEEMGRRKRNFSLWGKMRGWQRRERSLWWLLLIWDGRLVVMLVTCGGDKPVVMTVGGWNGRERGKEKWQKN